MYSSVRALLRAIVDYAGLFPPASLDLVPALHNFERYRAQEFAWALGRFVVPASRLGNLDAVVDSSSWPLSVLAGPDVDGDLAHIRAFALQHPGSVETVEVKADTVVTIREISEGTPSELPVFFEIPVNDSPASLLSAIAEEGCCAKVRTGGITAEAFPAATDLVRFLQLSSVLGVRFKATAGLHHPLRGVHRLTYSENSPSATMYGFLNMFLAAGFVRSHMTTALLTELLEESSPHAFVFSDDGVTWRNNRLSTEEIAAMRGGFGVAFGSCSFEEPLEDLRSLGLL